jgi:hypothetical protein
VVTRPRAISAVHAWFQSQQAKPTISRLIWPHPYSRILFDRDPWESHGFTSDRYADLKTLRDCEVGTMVVWNALVGPKWSGLRPKDFEAVFQRLATGRWAACPDPYRRAMSHGAGVHSLPRGDVGGDLVLLP